MTGSSLFYTLLLLHLPVFFTVAQSFEGRVVSESGDPISFAIIKTPGGEFISNVDGLFRYKPGDRVQIEHAFYTSRDTVLHRPNAVITCPRIDAGEIKKLQEGGYQRLLQEVKRQGHQQIERIDFNSKVQILVKTRPAKNPSAEWTRFYSVAQVVHNRFVRANNWYQKVLHSESINADGDRNSQKINIPVFSNQFNPQLEYLDILQERYLNPLYEDASNRYDYRVSTLAMRNGRLIYLLAIPSKPQGYKSVDCIAVFDASDLDFLGYSYILTNVSFGQISVTAVTTDLNGTNKIPKGIHAVGRFYQFPSRKSDMKIQLAVEMSDFVLSETDTTGRKLSLDVMDEHHTDSLSLDSEWQMGQLDKDISRNPRYINVDTTKGFSWDKAFDIGASVVDGDLAWKMRHVYLSNVFSINRFEGLRLGLGFETREEFSNKLLLQGYAGYGLGDGVFKYGGGIGLRIASRRKTIAGIFYRNDLREPGRTRYLTDIKDLFRNFFANRMDKFQDRGFILDSEPFNYFKFQASLESYQLTPHYSYTYVGNPNPTDTTSVFDFAEANIKARFGVNRSYTGGLSQFVIDRWTSFPVLYINYTVGFDNVLDGKFGYHKISGKADFDLDFQEYGSLKVTLDAGIMTINAPYQVMFNAPGSESALGSVIVKDAFQTMGLYQLTADRFTHMFTKFYFGERQRRIGRFNPRIGLAWSMGWGVIAGDKSIHQGIVIDDYPQGFYEAGLLLENLLNINFYRYFYTGLGIGVFYGIGDYIVGSPWAIRLTYDINPY